MKPQKPNKLFYILALPFVILGILACNIGLTTTQPTPTPEATQPFVLITTDPNASSTATPFQPSTPTPSPYIEAIGEVVFTETSAILNMTFFPNALPDGKSHEEKIDWSFVVNDLIRCGGEGFEGNHQCVWQVTDGGEVDPNTIQVFIDGTGVTLNPVSEGRYTFEITITR